MELWRKIVDNLAGAVVALSSRLEPLALNPAAETLLGVSHPGHAFFQRLADRNPWLERMIDLCLTSGQNLDNPDTVLLLERRRLSVRAEVSPLLSDSGEVEGAILLLHDLSHQKGAEQAHESDANALRLSPAGLAHEVKNPLTGIKGGAELLRAMFPGDPRAHQYCQLILDGVNRIAALVEQVLAVSGPHRLKREPVNIHQVIHQALRIAGIHPEPPPNLIVEQRFDPSLPELIGDAAALERVFLNLFRNALEAMGLANAVQSVADAVPGASARPAILRLRTAMETQFRVSSRGRRRQFLRVEISDNGKGMPPDELNQLFTPFFTTKPSGTGLGLVLSQKIIALHGGKLWAEYGGVANASDSVSSSSNDPAAQEAAAPGMTFLVMLPVGPE
ncbi:MAG TPA: ATP-binding protein [Candidatus Binataceae bacterium]|nr:ATP-binding protein [Candidatus Binataceae bacterium]